MKNLKNAKKMKGLKHPAIVHKIKKNQIKSKKLMNFLKGKEHKKPKNISFLE